MRSDHLNKHMKTHNPQTAKKTKDEKGNKQQNNNSGQQTPTGNKQMDKTSKDKSMINELSQVTAARLAVEERMMYNNNTIASSIVDYQTTPNLSTNSDIFLPHPHSFAPILDNANSMGYSMSYYS